MKKEMLRINNLNMYYSPTNRLAGVSLCLMSGECTGFLGLGDSGKNLLIELLCGMKKNYDADVYVNGIRTDCLENIEKSVYRITATNYLIENWTVAEYIFLISDPSFLGIYSRKSLIKKAEALVNEFGIDMDVDKKLKRLTELEKRLIDLIKAYSLGTRILIIEDEFEGCSSEEITQFKTVLTKVMKQDMVCIINSHSDSVLYILSDKYIIFKKGHIVKKCDKDYIKDNGQLEKFLLGTTITTKKKNLDNYKNSKNSTMDIMYMVKNVDIKGIKETELDFNKGEVVSILALDVKVKKMIFEILSGRSIDKSMQIYLEQKLCSFDHTIDFIRNRIVSISDLGGVDELLLRMSAGDNLLIPSLNKISSIQFILSKRRMTKTLEKEVKDNLSEIKDTVSDINANDSIILLLHRWYIYKPKVLILFEPFAHCDIYNISLVKAYIKKFTGLGTTVIIVKSRSEYIEDISDRVISLG